MTWMLAIILKPFVLLAFGLFCATIVVSIRKWMPECRLKRLLLMKV